MCRSSRMPRSSLLLCLALALLAAVCVRAVNAQVTEDRLAALDALRSGAFGPASPAEISLAEQGHIVPVLERKFALNTSPDAKPGSSPNASPNAGSSQHLRIAAELVRLGDREPAYWQALATQAHAMLAIDEPDAYSSDPAVMNPTPAFRAWATAHSLERLDQAENDANAQPEIFADLGITADLRAIPLLRQALQSSRESFRFAAAGALGRMHDTSSIAAIVHAIESSPPATRAPLARQLLEFDDAAATAAARPFLPELAPPTERLSSGELSMVDLEQIANDHTVSAVPPLAARFLTEKDSNLKLKIAGVLVRLGDKDDRYWSYLVEQATSAVESDAPAQFVYDPQGQPAGVAPAFVTWAAEHHITSGDDPFYSLPGNLLELAMTGDPRGIPLLRRALESHIALVQAIAAQGLAKIPDTGSIPLIIDACKRGPESAAGAIAMMGLICFNDPRAQAEAARHLPKELLGTSAESCRARLAPAQPSAAVPTRAPQ